MPFDRRKLLTTLLLCLVFAQAALAQLGKPRLFGSKFEHRFQESYKAIVDTEPQVSELELEILQKLDVFLVENPTYAQGMLEDMLTDGNPVSAAFNHALANIYYDKGDYLKAQLEYATAIQKHPGFRRAWSGLGMTLYKISDYAGAIEAISYSIKLGANDSFTYGILGYSYLQLELWESSEVAYRLATLLDPHSVEWAEGLAQVYMETSRHKEAASMLGELIRKEPDRADYWLLQANMWLAMDETLKTARNIEIARYIGIQDLDTYFLLGNIYLRKGMMRRAKEVFAAVLENSSSHSVAPALRAVRYLHERDEGQLGKELFESMEMSEEEWSRESRALYHLLDGDFAVDEERWDEAVDAYAKSLVLEPLNGATLLKLAGVYEAMGQDEKAYFAYDRAAGDSAHTYRALVKHAMLLIDNSKLEQAAEKLVKASELNPEDTRIATLLRQVRLVLKRKADAS